MCVAFIGEHGQNEGGSFHRCHTGKENMHIAAQERMEIRKKYSVTYNGSGIEIVKQFKYQGTISHEDVVYTSQKDKKSSIRCKTYGETIKFRVNQARKGLATWMRRCHT